MCLWWLNDSRLMNDWFSQDTRIWWIFTSWFLQIVFFGILDEHGDFFFLEFQFFSWFQKYRFFIFFFNKFFSHHRRRYALACGSHRWRFLPLAIFIFQKIKKKKSEKGKVSYFWKNPINFWVTLPFCFLFFLFILIFKNTFLFWIYI